jgi:16S rRNA C1402 N4-methylase RsmH
LTLSAYAAARQIADAITARRPEVLITRTGKLAAFVQRHAPFVLRGAFRVASRRVLAELERLG